MTKTFGKRVSKGIYIGLLFWFLIAHMPGAGAQGKSSNAKPNFIFILVDDLGWADLACYGSDFYETPNLDNLAAEGVRFSNAYASSPVCSPSRASILTGKYPARLDLTDWIPGRQATHRPAKGQKLLCQDFAEEIKLEEYSIAEALKDHDYHTFFAGKWHIGEDSIYWPEHQGFDINKGGWKAGSPKGGYFSPYVNPRLKSGPDGEYLTDRLTNEAIHFLNESKEQPFFLYLSFYTVHNPLNAKPETIEKYRKKASKLKAPQKEKFVDRSEWKQVLGKGNFRERMVQDHAVYAAMIEHMDENVGRLLQEVKDLKLDENTIVIFTSDNGGLSTSEGSPTSNLPLRAGKGWLYEGGIREPLIIKWPGVAKGGSVNHSPVIATDFYPSILEMAGIQAIPQQHTDGLSLVSMLKGDEEFSRDELYWHYPHYSNQGGRPAGAVRKGKYKLIEFYEDMQVELYDLDNDIGEQSDLSGKKPQLVKDLRKKLKDWRKSVKAKMPHQNPHYQP